MKKSIELFRKHWQKMLVFSLAILLIAIAMSFNRDSYVLQAWLGADKKEVIRYLYWVIGSSVIARCGFLKFEKNRKRNIRRLKEYGPWAFIAFFTTLISSVMFSDRASCAFQTWLGTDKKETIEFFGWAIGGAIALYGFLKLEERAKAQSDANDVERFNVANEHLSEGQSSEKNAMRRVASFYELYYLARDKESYRAVVLDILMAFLELMPKRGGDSKEKKHLLNVLLGKGRDLWEEFAKLEVLNLEKFNLQNIDFQNMDLRNVSLQDAGLQNANLQNIDLRNTNLGGADLQGADLRNTNLRGADLRNTNLGGADLRGADLRNTDMQDADMQGADLRGVKLKGANLTKVILKRGVLEGVILENVIFHDANLQMANLSGTNVQGANFEKANLKGANMLGMTNYTNANFRNAKYNVNTKEPTEDVHLSVLRMIMIVNEE